VGVDCCRRHYRAVWVISGVGEWALGSEDYTSFRPYVPGDSPRWIAWKPVGRADQLLGKCCIDQVRPAPWLDWRLLGIDNLEL
jgi:hypothetical protein